jgi:hypothetical protein
MFVSLSKQGRRDAPGKAIGCFDFAVNLRKAEASACSVKGLLSINRSQGGADHPYDICYFTTDRMGEPALAVNKQSVLFTRFGVKRQLERACGGINPVELLGVISSDLADLSDSPGVQEAYMSSRVVLQSQLLRRLNNREDIDKGLGANWLAYYTRREDDICFIETEFEISWSGRFASIESAFISDGYGWTEHGVFLSPEKFQATLVFSRSDRAYEVDVPDECIPDGWIGLWHNQYTQRGHMVLMPIHQRINIGCLQRPELPNAVYHIQQIQAPVMYALQAAVVLLRRVVHGNDMSRYQAWSFDFPSDMSCLRGQLDTYSEIVLRAICHFLIHFDVPLETLRLLRWHVCGRDTDGFSFRILASYFLDSPRRMLDPRGFDTLMTTGNWVTSLSYKPDPKYPLYNVQCVAEGSYARFTGFDAWRDARGKPHVIETDRDIAYIADDGDEFTLETWTRYQRPGWLQDQYNGAFH